MNEAGEGLGELVVSGCEPSRVFETIEASFDSVSKRVDRAVDFDLNAPVLFRRDDRRAAALLDIGADFVGIISAIGQQHLGSRRIFFHQWLVAFDIVGFARRERCSDREAVRVGAEMDLGREATSRTAKSVSLNPPLPPAAW